MKALEREFSISDRIVAKAKFSYFVFLREFIVAVLLGAIIAVLWVFVEDVNDLLGGDYLTQDILKYVLLGCAGFMIVMLFFEWLARYSKEVLVTEQKFVARFGVLRVRDIQLPLDQIKAVESNQNFVQHLLGFGDIIIMTDAQKPIVIHSIVKPSKFARRITRQKEASAYKINQRNMRLELVPTKKNSTEI